MFTGLSVSHIYRRFNRKPDAFISSEEVRSPEIYRLGVYLSLSARMRPQAAQVDLDPTLEDDPRWQLVERIVASPSFTRSPRLCSLLMHLCQLALEHRLEEINEQSIGEALFDRAPNYDPSIDGIVRSHASRLRQRLSQYFSEEGEQETIRLTIPKGGYTPHFERHSPSVVRSESEVPLPSPTSTTAEPPSAARVTPYIPKLYPHILRLAGAALASACVFIFILLAHAHFARPIGTARHPLWSTLFRPDRTTLIVASDTGLTALQTLTNSNVSLAEYLSGEYRTRSVSTDGLTSDAVKLMASRRYTSIVDLDIVAKLYQLPGVPLDRIRLRYARDLRPNDLKDEPAILLGSEEGTPWVQLFEDKMNFVFVHDHQHQRFLVLNRFPRTNEQTRYEADLTGPLHRVYGLVALRPNVQGSGNVLLLEGTSMAGTESAADFVFDDSRLLPFLASIKQRDGSLPYFELLLQSNNMNGSASGSEILSYRISPR